jgi:putative hydrolase of the HAD superfamily
VLERASEEQHAFLRRSFPQIERSVPHAASFGERFLAPALREAAALGKGHDMTLARKLALSRAAREAELDPLEVVEPAFEAFLAARSRVSDYIFPDVLAALRVLKERGFRLASLTNGNCDLKRCPELDELFEVQMSAERAGAAKPGPEPFLALLAEAGVQSHEVLHIGDSIESDVRGAKRVGMQTVWVDRAVSGRANEADLVIRCVADLPWLLGGLAAPPTGSSSHLI